METNHEGQGASDKNGTWDVVELPREKSQERCKSMFTIKYRVNGSLERVQSQACFQRYI